MSKYKKEELNTMNNQHRANDEDAQINDEEKGENDQEND